MKYSDDEKLLVQLEKVCRNSADISTRQVAKSLIFWFLRNHEWTAKQKTLANSICAKRL